MAFSVKATKTPENAFRNGRIHRRIELNLAIDAEADERAVLERDERFAERAPGKTGLLRDVEFHALISEQIGIHR